MRTFTKPTVIVSRCLEFEACRYNGDVITDAVVQSLMPYVTFQPICPEVEIGLGTPRETIRVIEENGTLQLIQPATGQNVTEKMTAFTNTYLQHVEADGFLLKSRSPSCATRDVKIYKGTIPGGKGSGLFGGAVVAQYGHLAIEEEGRLKNFTIREHFFTKLFTIAAFKAMKRQCKMRALVAFHSDNKYLFMAYNQTKLKEMGRIVANRENKPFDEVITAYESGLYDMLQRAARYTSHVNVCQHVFGYFKTKVTKAEKEHFLSLLEKYAEKKLPLSSVITLLRSWAIRFEEAYLLQQTYFEPYPEALVVITDSGKGRDY